MEVHREMSITGRDRMAQQVRSLGPWFHNLHLPDGTQTAPDHFLGDFPRLMWEKFAHAIPRDLAGWSALDIGCNAGFYSFELARRGARVTAIDHDERYLHQARWAAEQFDLAGRIAWRQLDVYQVPELETDFDLVLFMGTLYHLRYPLLAMDLVARCVRRLMVFQTLTMPGPAGPGYDTAAVDPPIQERTYMLASGFPKMAFIEHRLSGDPTNWWVPNAACVEAMLRSTGMRVVERPSSELYVCEPAPELAGGGRVVRAVRLA
ncbi:MAG: TIGR04290 family methyltransferase [Phycisphaeraceae bacterium]